MKHLRNLNYENTNEQDTVYKDAMELLGVYPYSYTDIPNIWSL